MKQRDRILDEALRLMSEEGSAAMSMRQLALACGVQVAAIYHYFPSKDALLESVFEERRYESRLADQDHSSLLNSGDSVPQRLTAVFNLFWLGALEEEQVLRLLLGEGLRNQAVALPTGSAMLELFRSGVLVLLEENVPEIPNPEIVADVFLGQIFAGFIRHIFDPQLNTDQIAMQAAQVLVRTVL
ncbi:MAG: helix-turn-helix domain-containing protein [Microthrixaceae bacterium]